ncbi:MAG: hypothetical protein D6784_15245, partial [Chloroflexi bacterium]
MDLMRKLELLLSATARSKLPRRRRQSILDAEEEKLLAQIRRAVADVRAQEQKLADRLKAERAQAETAARQGDRQSARQHERRAAELEQRLREESTQAINLEAKLAALEEKLARVKEAAARQQAEAQTRAGAAEQTLSTG